MNRTNRKSTVTTALTDADVPFSSCLYGIYAPLDISGRNAAQPLLAADNLASDNWPLSTTESRLSNGVDAETPC